MFSKKNIIIILSFIVIAIVTGYLLSKKYGKVETYEEQHLPMADTVIVEPIYEFGLRVDTLLSEIYKVKKNDVLAIVLSRNNMPSKYMGVLSNLPDSLFKSKEFKVGNKYVVYQSYDSALKYFVYLISPTEYIVFNFQDSLTIYRGKKEIKIQTKAMAATIKSSLWQTMVNKQANPVLAMHLSEIFAWVIDFFAVIPGDEVRVIYDELYVDSVSMGISKIHAASFTSGGQTFYAIPFEQNGYIEYFDADGKSLRRQFLKAPLRFSRISSKFSHSRMHPVLRIRRPHHGVDYAAPYGTPVMAIGNGRVIAKAFQRGGGNYLKIRHNSDYTTGYLHLQRFAKGVKVGSMVNQGQIIAYVGSTGTSTGPHLDFRVWRNGKPIDPLSMKSPPVFPVKAELMFEFTSLVETFREALLRIN